MFLNPGGREVDTPAGRFARRHRPVSPRCPTPPTKEESVEGLREKFHALSCCALRSDDEDGFARLAAPLLGFERGATLAERPGGTDHRAKFARNDSLYQR